MYNALLRPAGRLLRQHRGDKRCHRLREPDVVSCGLGEVPAVVKDLMEELGGLKPAPQLRGDCSDGGLEDLAEPAMGGDGLGESFVGSALQLGAEVGEIAEQPASLVLLDLEAGEGLEGADMVAGVDH